MTRHHRPRSNRRHAGGPPPRDDRRTEPTPAGWGVDRACGAGRAHARGLSTALKAEPCSRAISVALRTEPEPKEVRSLDDSDATEGVQDEKVGISCDYPIGATADRQLKYLVVLGVATGPNRLGDLYQLSVPEQQSKKPFSLTRLDISIEFRARWH